MEQVLAQLFRPIAQLAVARGMRFAEAAEVLRRAFLRAAQQAAGPEASASRLSVVSGLQRRDVTRLLAEPEAVARPNPLSQIVARWLAEADGTPLPRHGEDGSFDALARSVRKDVHPKAQLDALVAVGTAAVQGDHVRLMRRAHVPAAGSAEQLAYLGANGGDHLAAAVGNIVGDARAYDLSVHYNRLSDAALAELDTLWRARMNAVLGEMNARAAALQNESPGDTRFRAGGYFHKEPEEREAAP